MNSNQRVKICVIDDTDEGTAIVGAALRDMAKCVEICSVFSRDADITVYLSSHDHVLKNIRAGSNIIIASNRLIKTNVAVRAIICGMYEKATVTASSVNFTDDTAEFVYCLQRAVMMLDGSYAEIGEIKVKSAWNCLEKVLAAVTVRIMVCGGSGNFEDFIELKKLN